MWWAAVATASRTVTSEVSSLGGGAGEGLPGQQPRGVGLQRPRQMLGAGTLMPAHQPRGRIHVQNVKFLCCEQILPFAADGEGVWSPGGPLPCKAVGRRPEGGSFLGGTHAISLRLSGLIRVQVQICKQRWGPTP